MLGYSALLASVAGFVNAVALLVLAFPVGNLTGVTTQLGMNTANPWLYEGHVLTAILFGFLTGTAAAGAILARTQVQTGRRHATVLGAEAVLLLLAAAGVEDVSVKAVIAASGIEQTVVQALLAAAALGLPNGLTSSFHGMAIRTTHFTGTVTDLGLMHGPQPHPRDRQMEGCRANRNVGSVSYWRGRRGTCRRSARRIRVDRPSRDLRGRRGGQRAACRTRRTSPTTTAPDPIPATGRDR